MDIVRQITEKGGKWIVQTVIPVRYRQTEVPPVKSSLALFIAACPPLLPLNCMIVIKEGESLKLFA